MQRDAILVAGAGIAGLATAIALAERGHRVHLIERSASIDEIGAGIQLSPNATRLLDRMGVLERLLPFAVEPDAVAIRGAKNLREIARVPLANARSRWGAPYLTIHRADLQSALLEMAVERPLISMETGAELAQVQSGPDGLAATIRTGDGDRVAHPRLLVGADGVRSAARRAIDPSPSRFSGKLAWRATPGADHPAVAALLSGGASDRVTAFVHPGFHLVAYPIRGGAAVNFAGFTTGAATTDAGWSSAGDAALLHAALARTAPTLRALADAATWTCWPVHTAPKLTAWQREEGVALVGDAAHAMTPFAAQGAAMAIEDAVVLARCLTEADLPLALKRYESLRKARVERVARRGAWNGFTWHVGWPASAARNLILSLLGPERLAAQLDWLYDHDAGASAQSNASASL